MADLIARYGGGGRSRPDGGEGGDQMSSKIGEVGAAAITALVLFLIATALIKLIVVVVSL